MVCPLDIVQLSGTSQNFDDQREIYRIESTGLNPLVPIYLIRLDTQYVPQLAYAGNDCGISSNNRPWLRFLTCLCDLQNLQNCGAEFGEKPEKTNENQRDQRACRSKL